MTDANNARIRDTMKYHTKIHSLEEKQKYVTVLLAARAEMQLVYRDEIPHGAWASELMRLAFALKLVGYGARAESAFGATVEWVGALSEGIVPKRDSTTAREIHTDAGGGMLVPRRVGTLIRDMYEPTAATGSRSEDDAV